MTRENICGELLNTDYQTVISNLQTVHPGSDSNKLQTIQTLAIAGQQREHHVFVECIRVCLCDNSDSDRPQN